MTILTFGVHEKRQMREYLECEAVSASMLLDLDQRCPRAAWFNSWLNPRRPSEDSNKAADAGTIAHSILLEGHSSGVVPIDPNDYPTKSTGNIPDGWTNNAIRAARDAARAAGKIPVLKAQMGEIEAMVGAAREYIESLRTTEPAIYALFQPDGGDSELTITWDDAGTPCRMRPDRISKDRGLIVDYKTGGTTAEPGIWGRTQMIRMGYYVGAAFYCRGAKATFGIEPEYVYLVQEQEAPYLCSLVGIDPMGRDYGDRSVTRTLRIWRECAAARSWPAYPNRVAYAEFPAWEAARQEDAEIASGTPYDPSALWSKAEAAR